MDRTQYRYDAFGRRVNKVNGSLYYVYDQAGQLLAEVDRNAGDDFFRSYVYAEDELVGFVDQVSRSTGGCAGIPPVGDELGLHDFWWLIVPAAALFVLVVPGLRRRPIAATGVMTIALVAGAAGLARSGIVSVAFFWVHTDHLGTPLAVTDTPANPANAKVVWRATYEAFGKATVDEDPDGDQVLVSLNVRFPGQYYDAESGLHYNFYRTYDPATGRYLEADPSGQFGSELNPFRMRSQWKRQVESMAWFRANPSLDIEGKLTQRVLYLRSMRQSGLSFQPIGANLFTYVLGDPVNLIDATGLDPKRPRASHKVGGSFGPFVVSWDSSSPYTTQVEILSDLELGGGYSFCYEDPCDIDPRKVPFYMNFGTGKWTGVSTDGRTVCINVGVSGGKLWADVSSGSILSVPAP